MTGIAQRFGRAAAHYDQAAQVQRDVATELARRIGTLDLPRNPRILDVGCGTGFLSAGLMPLKPSLICLSDIAPAMVMAARRRVLPEAHVRAVAMDGARPCFAEASFDLVCGSLSFQWFDDPASALPGLCQLLAPGGYLAFSTLADDNFPEWRCALEAAGLAVGVPRFTKPEGWRECLPPGACINVEQRPIHHADARDFLAGLKRIGADTPAPGYRPLPPGALRRVMRRFESGLTVTYSLVYGVYRRPGSAKTA